MLSQGNWNEECVIAYASKFLSASQRNWVTFDREWWVIIWSILHSRPYLAGRHFTVVTPQLGAPEQLHSDQGKNLNAKIVIDVCDILQTCKIRTTPFHPQSDGATERVIRTVNVMLSKVVSENQKDWDEKRPAP